MRGPGREDNIWPDDVHSNKPHQQYADFLKSKMYRNDRLLVTCSDCHDLHGDTPYRRWLIHDPDNAASPLCQRCHTVDVLSHMETKLNARMKGQHTRCIDCHMPGTANTGGIAGEFGRMINTPPYASAQEEESQRLLAKPDASPMCSTYPRRRMWRSRHAAGPGDADPVHVLLRHVSRGERVALQIEQVCASSVIEQARVLDDRTPLLLKHLVLDGLIRTKLVRQVVVTGARERDGNLLVGGVFPIPAMNAGERRRQGTGGLHPLALFICLRVAPWPAVGLGMELDVHQRRRLPGIQERFALIQPVLVFRCPRVERP